MIAEMEDKIDRLKHIGFIPIGEWQRDGDGMSFEAREGVHVGGLNVLYAFVAGGKLEYIGKTVKGLKKRFANYRNAGKSQITNIRNRRLILDCLKQGRAVEIYALPDNGLLFYGGFHINLAAGLEDSLIDELDPPWNKGLKETETENLEAIDA